MCAERPRRRRRGACDAETRTAAAAAPWRLSTQRFEYIDYGNLAAIGRRAAVVDLSVPLIGAVRFSGFPAWLFRLVAHIWFLIGLCSRLVVMFDWAWASWTCERSARVIAAPQPVPGSPTVPPATG